MTTHPPKLLGSRFTIVHPDVGECYNPDAANTVLVFVRDSLLGNDGYAAAITDIGTAPAAFTPLIKQIGTQFYSGRVAVGGVVPSSTAVNNKTVTVRGFQGGHQVGGSESKNFKAQTDPCGSGSSGSGVHRMEAQRCHFCHAHEPVPVELTLQLDTPVSPGTAADCGRLNHPTVLRHAGHPAHPGSECAWLSHPIDFCSDAANQALWMLRKTDARTWILILRRGKTNIVSYRHATAVAKDCSFPIQLHLADVDGHECKHWPHTVTVCPAP